MVISVWTCQSLQLSLTLCGRMDYSQSGSSVHRILRARILQCVAMPSSRGSPCLRARTCVSHVSCTGSQLLHHQCRLGSLVFILFPLRGCRARCILRTVYFQFSGEGNGNPLQYSCLENSMDGEAWQDIVCGVAKSQT